MTDSPRHISVVADLAKKRQERLAREAAEQPNVVPFKPKPNPDDYPDEVA